MNTSPVSLEVVAEHFALWRSKRKRGERIPQRLWSEAVALVDGEGLARVAHTLRLNPTELKTRRRQRTAEAAEESMELVQVDPLVVAQALGERRTAMSLELERIDGMRLRIEGGGGAELLGVVERFLSGAGSCCS